jgi:hypothetical protein
LPNGFYPHSAKTWLHLFASATRSQHAQRMADPPQRLDYLPYDEREALRYLCRALLDAVSAVKGAQGT